MRKLVEGLAEGSNHRRGPGMRNRPRVCVLRQRAGKTGHRMLSKRCQQSLGVDLIWGNCREDEQAIGKPPQTVINMGD